MTTSPTQGEHAQTEAWTNLLAYVLQGDMHNRLTPRVIDIAYTAFTLAKQPNAEDGGPSDWFNDTRPKVKELIEKLRKDLMEDRAQVAALTAQPAAPQGVAYAELPKDVIRAVFIENGFTVKEGQTDLKQYVYDAANELLRRAHALRASNGQAPAGAANWWRKRADEIEVQVAHTGSQEAMSCYTAMRTLLQAATAQAAPAAGAVAGPTATREFTNELGNAIRITVEGPNSMHENIVTPMEAEQFRSALNEHAMRAADTTWCAYVAGMICTYLKEDAEGDKATAIAGIIERRLMFLSRSTAPMDRDTLYLLRRLLSNQFTFTSAEFRAELEKIVEGATRAPADSVLEDAAQESEYRRGYRHGYEQRDAEVRGALA